MDAERTAERHHVLEHAVPVAAARRDLPVLAEGREVVDEEQDPRLALVARERAVVDDARGPGVGELARPAIELGAQHPEQPHDALVVLAGDHRADPGELLEHAQRAGAEVERVHRDLGLGRERGRRGERAKRHRLARAARAEHRHVAVDVGLERDDLLRLALRDVAHAEREAIVGAPAQVVQVDRGGQLVEPRPARRGDARATGGLGHHVDHALLIGRPEILALLGRLVVAGRRPQRRRRRTACRRRPHAASRPRRSTSRRRSRTGTARAARTGLRDRPAGDRGIEVRGILLAHDVAANPTRPPCAARCGGWCSPAGCRG